MANYRTAIRPVTTEQTVRLVDCDSCGKTAELPEYGDADKPGDWYLVAHGGALDGVFCSPECVRQWGSGNAELTAIARKAFSAAQS